MIGFLVLIYILVFCFGTAVGSFLNVVADRFERAQSINGRSFCEFCKQTLRWFELIPLLSFLFQKGKCRRCQKKLSFQYPLAEFFTGVSFVLVFYKIFGLINESVFLSFSFGGNLLSNFISLLAIVFPFVITSLLIVIFIYDLKHKIIPNFFSYTFSFLSLLVPIYLTTQGSMSTNELLLYFLAGPILAFPFAFLWFISRGRLMGLGDAKFILGIGWLFGISLGVSALMIAFWSGAIVGVFLIAFHKIKASHWGQRTLSGGKNELTMKS